MAEVATAAVGALETTPQKQPPAVTPERLRTRIVAFALVAAVTFLAVFALGTSYSPAPTPLPPPPAIRPSSLDRSHTCRSPKPHAQPSSSSQHRTPSTARVPAPRP